MRPELVQVATLSPDHFRRHPVWIGCHTVDYDAEWYDETDEETFRPWVGTLPADPAEGTLLVRATLALADGTEMPGFLTPGFPEESLDPLMALGTIQPRLFLPSGLPLGFWEGMCPRPELRDSLYSELGRSVSQVFPIHFMASAQLATGVVSGRIDGFCSIPGLPGPVTVAT